MDPNENLRLQLKIAQAIVDGDDGDAANLAELVLALHQWMANGGFPPDAWYSYGEGGKS